MHNGLIREFDRLKRDLAFAVDPSLYPHIEGSTDSELFFFLALSFGLTDSPLDGVAKAVAFIEATGERYGITHPVQLTVATTNGASLWAFRYSSDGQARSLFHSAAIDTLREQYPDNPVFQELSAETRMIVSEPLGDLAGVWQEFPQATCAEITGGECELRPFALPASAG